MVKTANSNQPLTDNSKRQSNFQIKFCAFVLNFYIVIGVYQSENVVIICSVNKIMNQTGKT